MVTASSYIRLATWGDKVSVALHWFRYDRKSGVISYDGTDSGLDGSRIGALSGFAGLRQSVIRVPGRGVKANPCLVGEGRYYRGVPKAFLRTAE